MLNELLPKEAETSLVSTDFSQFENYLAKLGLPTDNIIASPEERFSIMENIPTFMEQLSPDFKKDARYLSKFIAGAAVGLFDASLNFVWNEVVINIRKKVVFYGLDLFFDEAVGLEKRGEYNTEEDLTGLKDRTLLDTCLKLELISPILHNKLVHILDMRNNIGASHPTEYSINSYELLGWLKTCVSEVLAQKASDSAITVQRIISNIKKASEEFSIEVISQFSKDLPNVSKILIGNLLGALFGIYCDNQTTGLIRKNIKLIIPYVWEQAIDDKKYELGIKIDQYIKNLDNEKEKLAKELFEICHGERYYSVDSKVLILGTLNTKLLNIHYDRDNFYNEVPVIKEIMLYIKDSNDIPKEIELSLIKTIMICRIGKNVSWNNGVSPNGKIYYEKFFKILNNDQVIATLKLLNEPIVKSNLEAKITEENTKEILTLIKNDTLGDRLNEIIDYLLKAKNLSSVYNEKKFIEISKGILL